MVEVGGDPLPNRTPAVYSGCHQVEVLPAKGQKLGLCLREAGSIDRPEFKEK